MPDSNMIALGPPLTLDSSHETTSLQKPSILPTNQPSFSDSVLDTNKLLMGQEENPFAGSPAKSLAGRPNGNAKIGQHSPGFVDDPTSTRVDGDAFDHRDRRTSGEDELRRGMVFKAGPPSAHDYPPTSSTSQPSSGPSNPIRIPAEQSPPPPPHPLSLSAYLAEHPHATVGKALRKTYPKPNPLIRLARRFKVRHSVIHGLTEKKMEKLEDKEGKTKREQAGWRLADEPETGPDGRPRALVSPLFWKVYLSVLPTLERDPLSGLVPPPLLGSTATMPLSIISLIPDIMRHYRDVIVRAEKEVFLVTNYWQ
jgi:hypothetical protein